MASAQGTLAGYGANLANLTSLFQQLPAPVQVYFDTSLDYLSGVTDSVQSATGLSPTTLYSTVGAVLVAAVSALAARNSRQSRKGKMSSRYGYSARGGISPFGSTLGHGGVPAVTEDDFSYITSEDLETFESPRHHRHHSHGAHGADHYSRSAPALSHPEDDVMLIKHREVTYPEHFPAYSIGDGKLEVDDVIQRVKMIMDLSERDARRIRLFYKGRQLKEPRAPVREYGVKNNSQVMVVLGEPVGEGSGESSEEVVVVGRDGRDSREELEPPKRSRKSKRGRRKADDRSPRESTASLGLEVPVEDDRRRGASRVRTRSPTSISNVSGASAAAGVPGGPIEKLNSIAQHFDAKLRPLCDRFSDNPPSDERKRTDEHRKISETVMQQVLLKLDAIETGGEEGARAARKELVRDVQAVLKRMDDRLAAAKS